MHTQDTIRTLNRLIQACRDGEAFCRVGAGRAGSAYLAALLRDRTAEWGRLGDELQALVLLLEGEPATSGTAAQYVRRICLVMRTVLTGSADAWVTEAWHDIERKACERYAEAMSGYLPERIRRTVGLQADRIGDRCDQVGSLRSAEAGLAGRAPRTV